MSFSGSRDKARLAKAQNFDAQISHALGAYAVGIWRFEEGSGTTAHDESGYGNDGTFHGNPTPVFPAGVYSGTTALQFDGGDDYVDCGNGNAGTLSAITISAWIYPILTKSWSAIVQTADAGDRAFYVHSNKLQFYSSCDSIETIPLNTWTHVAVTVDGSDRLTYYINGNPSGGCTSTSNPRVIEYFHISGRGLTDGENFPGAIDDVRIYDEALSSAQIQQHFAAGAASHGIAVK